MLHKCSTITYRVKTIVRKDTNFLTDGTLGKQNAEMFDPMGQIFTGNVSVFYSPSSHNFCERC